MKKFKLVLIISLLLIFSGNTIKSIAKSTKDDKISKDCTFKGFKMYGKVKFVTSFPDIKVQIVESFPDLKVKFVDSFPDDCGEWQIVESFPDIKVQIVTSFPDIKIKTVDSFPGL